MAKSAILTVRQWGNSLAVRIPAAVARSARLRVGQPVEVSAQDSNALVKAPYMRIPNRNRNYWSAVHDHSS
jgi:antitoxin component of MazEF toxin-antitoxin module